MKRACWVSLAAILVFFAAPAVWATTFTLGFTGTDAVNGGLSDPWSGDYFCTLQAAGGGTGAQGWSLSMTADNAKISAITIEGTDAKTLYNEGFKKSETTSGAGNEGAVSAVVLSLQEAASLPPDSTSTIAKITVGGTIAAGCNSAVLRYVDGRKGSGQKVNNNVTQDGNTVDPAVVAKDIRVCEVVSCCGKQINVGFSSTKTSSTTPYVGILDDGTGHCSGGGGNITTEVAQDATGERHAYANLSSEDPAGGVDPAAGIQGWSFSIALDGAIAFGAGKVTISGTSVDLYYSEGFKKTEVIDPARNAGQRGAVSAVVLSLQEARNLPPIGTETVLDLDIVANGPQGDADITGSLMFRDGLRGSGQAVQNAITIGGNTVSACNPVTANIQLVFKLRVDRGFAYTRGNPNNDEKINLADAVWIINELFRGGPASNCSASTDVNGDGSEDAADALYLVHYLFTSGPMPPEPFMACARDPMDPTKCEGEQVACP